MKLPPAHHRPWPLPARPWVMAMRWQQLLFMHWPVPAEQLASVLPPPLQPHTFDGQAWLGVVPFIMADVRLRGTPAIPVLSRFCELNVRTYVTVNDRPGVYFFSLDCASAATVCLARRIWRLPYFHAKMTAERDGDGYTHYLSNRTDLRAPRAVAALKYRPTSEPAPPAPDSLEHFLTERYALYTAAQGQALRCGEIHHAPWPLQSAECHVALLDMTRVLGCPQPESPPLLHYAEALDVVAYLPRPVALQA